MTATDTTDQPATDYTIINGASDAETVFADGLIFATRLGSAVRLQFAEYVPQASNHPDPGMKTRIVKTIVMPIEGYDAMLQYLVEVTPQYIHPPVEGEEGGE